MQYRKPLIFAGAGILLTGAVQAQVTLDGTVGPAGTLLGPNYAVTADLGQQAGGNLFHSFGQFSVNTGESATFSGPNSVSNIIGRVTGGQMSFIDGTIQSTIPGANLYLLNPAGMLFGENARLDVNGAFHASTADYVRLSDGGRFDARVPANSILTVAPVTAFGFLSESLAPITVNGGFLAVPAGQTLSLIGGDLELIDATLYAPSGQINLAAVGSAGEVVPTATDLALRGFGRLGAITVERSEAARIVIDEVELGDIDVSGPGGGAIFIRGGQFVAHGRSQTQANTTGDQDGRGISVEVDRLILTGGARITTSTSSAGRGGNIDVIAREDILIDGAYFDVEANRLRPSGLIADVLSDSGNGGNISLSTTRLALTGGGAITSIVWNKGSTARSGDLHITAVESIDIDAINPDFVGNVDVLGISSVAARYAGNIHISTGRLTLTGGGSINTFTWDEGPGRGGDIHIDANESVSLDGPQSLIIADAYGERGGDAGDITLATKRLSLTGGGQISSSIWGAGSGGNLHITASESIFIDGSGYDASSGFHFLSGLFTSGYETSTGDAGTITVNTGRLSLAGGGQISSLAMNTGRAGQLTINANEGVFIASDAVISVTSNINNAGSITLIAPSLLIDAGDDAIGGGGNIADSAGIFANSRNASGGNVTINADHIKLLNDAQITSSVSGNELTEGGNITINSTNLATLNGSDITARATEGQGGNIQVNADVFLHDAASAGDVLNASSQVTGNDGTVAINAPNADPISSLTVLPSRYLSAADRISDRCGASDPDSRSRFTVQGRRGLTPDPKQPAVSPVTGCSSATPPALARVASASAPTSAVQPAIAGANFGDY